jgi:predicted RNase H-like nuclease
MRTDVVPAGEPPSGTSSRAKVVCGVDGCRLGWVVARLAQAPDAGVQVSVQLCVRPALVDIVSGAERVFIDMPMGLAETGERPVDRQLRALLGRQRSSVFSPPIRACLSATTYAAALALQREREGRGFSIQAWNLMPGIRLLDEALRLEPMRVGCWLESHPEWVFRGWMQQVGTDPDTLEPKKSEHGRRQREQLLVQRLPEVEEAATGCAEGWAGCRRSQAGVDDLLDALALAVSAWESLTGGLEVLGGEDDGAGIPMRVVRGRRR